MQREILPMEELMKLLSVQLQKGSARLTVTGCSMHPTLRHLKDSVTLILPDRPLKKGDLILYQRRDGQYVLHRIVGTHPGGFTCCGDNQWQKEDVAEDQVIALTVCLHRGQRDIPVESPGYRFRVNLWIAWMPVRKYLLGIRRVAGNLRRGIARKIK